MKPLLIALCLSGLFTVTDAIRADEKKDSPKGEVTGTLILDGKSYKLQSALAYEITKFDVKFTVIYLSEKPLDAGKLKASFKKKGNDEDFHTSDAHVRLMFDDQGKLFQISMHAGGGNVVLQGDPNIKTEFALKDGAAKGTAKSVKPDKDYTLDTTFDAKLIKP
jgi:hypothetical protein